MKEIFVLATGGTFDKEYNELNGSLFFKETHIPGMLKLGRSTLSIRLETLYMVDSLEMTNEQREALLSACINCPEKKILITHGTDRIVETAVFLGNSINALEGKTIVLTGAMVPYTFGSSDGMYNLGSSMAFVQVLEAGIYVSMNGRYFTWDNVRKNREIGQFEELK
ncbi:MAG: asparaginase [Spirochaetales bacterium]|nr:asparaginase [Spirochaetales bacterium]